MEMLLLLGLLGLATGWDLQRQRVPNSLLLPFFLMALTHSWLTAGWPGLKEALAGMLVPLGVFWPGFTRRYIGGGDVKLAMVTGGFLGYPRVLTALFYTLLVGGGFALFALWRHRRLGSVWRWRGGFFPARRLMSFPFLSPLPPRCPCDPPKISATSDKVTIPYAPVLALGVLVAYLTRFRCF